MTFKGRPVTAECILMMVTLWVLLTKQKPIPEELKRHARLIGIDI